MPQSRTQSTSYTRSTEHDKGGGVREWVAPHLPELQNKMRCVPNCYVHARTLGILVLTSTCVIHI